MCYSVRAALMIPLAPLSIPMQIADVGIPILLPFYADATFWEIYWKKKHKEMDKYGKKPICKTTNGPHVFREGHVPADDELTVNKSWTGIGGY